MFWINSGLIREFCKKESGFQQFCAYFAYFPHFTIFSIVQQIGNLSFWLKINIANIKTPKTMITESFFPAIRG